MGGSQAADVDLEGSKNFIDGNARVNCAVATHKKQSTKCRKLYTVRISMLWPC